MSTDIKETYEGLVDGAKVVSAYRAFAEADQPYCISADLGDRVLWATFQPSLPDDLITAEEADEANRRNIVKWVTTLTELIEKAKAWDDFVNDINAIADVEDIFWTPESAVSVIVGGDNPTMDAFASPYQVDRLGYDETDQVWMDRDGDYFKFLDGEWWFATDSNDPPEDWTDLVGYENLLTDFGPYTAVRTEPRKVIRLTAAERDARWYYINFSGDRFDYYWDEDEWVCDLGNGKTIGVGADGPDIGNNAGHLVEVL
ncbi:hypothetical protein SEA_NANOSMITE_54 [Mycobacterium phage Nanosmite]|nr:hypothetical protein SEA_NANOSMITE_54 [Mycobacterium phage Nanosmite]